MKRRAFTLIELLVVIAILGLLAAILFPVFAKVHDKARQTACVSNLRQLGQAFMAYAQDNNERLPVQQFDDQRDILKNRNILTTAWELKLRPFITTLDIARCPSDTTSVPYTDPHTGVTVLQSYATPGNVAGRPLTQIPTSALTVLLVESQTFDRADSFDGLILTLGKKSFTLEDGVVWEPPDFRHRERANYLFLDGHVKTLQGPNPTFPGYKADANGVALCADSDPLPR